MAFSLWAPLGLIAFGGFEVMNIDQVWIMDLSEKRHPFWNMRSKKEGGKMPSLILKMLSGCVLSQHHQNPFSVWVLEGDIISRNERNEFACKTFTLGSVMLVLRGIVFFSILRHLVEHLHSWIHHEESTWILQWHRYYLFSRRRREKITQYNDIPKYSTTLLNPWGNAGIQKSMRNK